jgi:hypothetical protein
MFADPLPHVHRFVAHEREPEEAMASEPRDKRPEIRLSQLSHGAG